MNGQAHESPGAMERGFAEPQIFQVHRVRHPVKAAGSRSTVVKVLNAEQVRNQTGQENPQQAATGTRFTCTCSNTITT